MSAEGSSPGSVTSPADEFYQPADCQNQKQRNLINQRNFRSRRKQRLEEVEQKLRKFELAGVAATGRVQMAARVVAAENTVLRELARNRLGLTEEDLHRYISEEMRKDHSLIPVARRGPAAHSPGHEVPFHLKQDQEPQARTSSEDPLRQHAQDRVVKGITGSSNFMVRLSPRLRKEHTEERDISPTAQSPFATAVKTHGGEYGGQNVAIRQEPSISDAQIDASLSEGLYLKTTPENLMSCEQAAAIISELRVQASLELIREELGCVPHITCSVTHGELFQKLDEEI